MLSRKCPFSLQLDETTNFANNALLMAYVHYKTPNSQEMAEEFCLQNIFKQTPKARSYLIRSMRTYKRRVFP